MLGRFKGGKKGGEGGGGRREGRGGEDLDSPVSSFNREADIT